MFRYLLNNGGGYSKFTQGGVYTVGSQPFWIASGDLNGDGYPDLVTANTNVNGPTGTVSVLLNNKNGTFADAATYTVGNQPYQVAIGDINGDGYPDLAVTNYGANTVSILIGSKTGTFTVRRPRSPLARIHTAWPSATSHITVSRRRCHLLQRCRTGSFPEQRQWNIRHAIHVHGGQTQIPLHLDHRLGDFNRDGKLDIVVGNTTANNISFFAGNGNNTFAASVKVHHSISLTPSLAGDFNGDGILDIAGVAPNFNAVELTLGVGDGTFGTLAQRAAGELTAKTQPWASAVGDFNNDGHSDIVTANTYHQVNLANSPAYQTRFLTEYPGRPRRQCQH